MKVRIIQGFANYEPGQVFEDWPAGMCEIFIAKGLIEPLEIEAADEQQEIERAEMTARRKKK
jgi:hypothetical protein